MSELLIRQAKTTCKKQLNEVYAAAGKTRNLRTDGIQAEFNFFFFFFLRIGPFLFVVETCKNFSCLFSVYVQYSTHFMTANLFATFTLS